MYNATGGLNRRSTLKGGLGMVAAALVAACSDPAASDAGQTGEIVIGASLELTGTGSVLGKLQEQALKVGVDEINAIGIPYGEGRLYIRTVVKDNGGNPATAMQNAKDLIENDKVSAIVGGVTVETARAMIPVAESAKVPLLCLNSGDEISVPLPQRKFVYQLGPNPSDTSAVMARDLRRQGLAKIAVLASGDGHGDAGVRALPRALTATGRDLVDTVRLPKSGRAFEAAAQRIVDAEPDAVIVWAQAPLSAAAAAALRNAGFAGRIFLDPGAGADETLNGPNGAALDGAYIVHSTVLAGAPTMATTPSGRAARAFIFRYIQEYGAFSGFAPYAADALTLVATAARRAVSTDPQRLRGRLEGGPIEGVCGAYAFQPISHGGIEPDALTLFVARQGAWVRLS
ncbi:ABC transporter substrate-binding protein [Catellatospora tritici]|uniref:ABC transporter substrate-binding protein n=1 Tax=Catellatospora tritici TaxID=2851566 RepID=UPI001C2DCA71|nr:ABC transporter substrate-binding protein [Catellatospora tritici]MBV1849145.1 ABC transporter substrate-binding protein [Catellatospora tritici]